MKANPGSIVRAKGVINSPWYGKRGKVCRIGFYSKADGLEVIWLVDQYGNYVETTDSCDFSEWFELLHDSKITDLFGEASLGLGPLSHSPLGDVNWS